MKQYCPDLELIFAALALTAYVIIGVPILLIARVYCFLTGNTPAWVTCVVTATLCDHKGPCGHKGKQHNNL